MSSKKFNLKLSGWELFLALALAAVAAWLVTRNWGLNPVVFADEMLYSAFARLTPLAEASIPSYLYFGVYGLTRACGDAFLDCARVFNTVFLVGAAPFLYLLARRFVDKPLAVLVVLLSVCAPFNSFTAYFMPETMYFFVFYVLTWLAFVPAPRRWALQATALGVLLGLMTLIKVHALFLIPSLALFVACTAWTAAPQGRRATRALAAAALATVAVMAVKFGAGFAIGGLKGLQLFGSFYGTLAHDTARHSFLPMLAPGWINLRGHLMALAISFGVPMALLGQALCSAKTRAAAGQALTALHLYTALVLGAALVMTVAYTASIAEYGVNEGLRLHQRYYDFAFPLLYLVAAAAIGHGWRSAIKWLPWALAACLGAATVLAVIKLPTYRLIMIDTPEVASLFRYSGFALPAALVAVLALGLWAWRQRSGAKLYLYVLAPLLMLQSQGMVSGFLWNARTPNPFDIAGKEVHALLPPEERGAVMVAGTNLGELMRAKFHLDARDATLFELEEKAPFDINYTPVRKKWLLVVGDHPLPAALAPQVKTDTYALVKIAAVHQPIGSAAFNAEPDGKLVKSIEGVSWVEWWGRWSDAKEVAIHFAQPLPKHLSLVLTAQAYGPNADQEFVARVGETERRFRVKAAAEIFLPFETDGKQDTLRITVPQPVAPSQASNPGDHRTIGLGLLNLEIGTNAASESAPRQ
jgi:hypothetical protein